MEVSVTLFGGLRHYLPAGSSFNKCKIDIDAGSSLEALLAKVPVPADKPYMVILNDEKVASDQYADVTIQGDDEVVLLPPIKGG
ncbi:MAG: MoaD/ThiS family protein [Gammaproteobacteria bacterium]|nr:MAG: MoaD/ThiS family protein [Gammaproteobacteria bacterium]UCH41602.1 MAG: MoaD/ThiS family protein [Gammaproteobacteria bacterium]